MTIARPAPPSAAMPAGRLGRLRAWRPSYEAQSAGLFLLPVMTVLAAVAVFPILYSLYLSFFGLKLTRPNRVPFVGLDNYADLLTDAAFWAAVGRTVEFTLICVGAIAVLALLVALLLNEVFHGRPLIGALLLVPWAIPSVANGLMWKWIYDSGYGALNGALYQLGIIDSYTIWLGDPAKTMVLIGNAFVWKELPLAAILILVTMKSIPSDLYRAAKVDGANVLQRFIHITFADYLLPTACEVPAIELLPMHTPNRRTPAGIKGMAEGGVMGATGAVGNAVNDALAPFGVVASAQPFSPDRLRALLRNAPTSSPG